jgi:peptidoglycan/xylan/chitin deacetylase (PgdA/CDA1 family)
MPALLALLREEGVSATFFTTGDVARRFPTTIRRILDDGHELGCHGDTHRRFGELDPESARREIVDASAVLRQFGPVTSFRAPNLDFPASYVPFLRDAGYTLDSSEGRHKPGSFLKGPSVQDGVRRVPASTAPSLIRLPRFIREAALGRMRDPVVLFFHPWEFTDVTREPIPLDCRFGTGKRAVETLRETIRYFRARDARFVRMRDVVTSATAKAA